VYKPLDGNDTYGTLEIGETQAVVVATVAQPYGLCDLGHQGLFLDKEWKAYDNRNRVLVATLGRFAQRDPSGYIDGVSLYQYVRSCPPHAADPLGLWNRDFHEFKTAQLAAMAGMCFPSEVGEWANAPDTGWRRAGPWGLADMAELSYVPVFGSFLAEKKLHAMQEWHFPIAPGDDEVIPGSLYAMHKYKEGIAHCNLQEFSEGLHTFQDSWAHQGKPTVAGIGHARKRKETWGPAGASTDADNVDFWPEDARKAAKATFNAMLEFMTECSCIKNGPHAHTKSRCGSSTSLDVDAWISKEFRGKNLPGVGGYEPPPPSTPVYPGGTAYDYLQPNLTPQMILP